MKSTEQLKAQLREHTLRDQRERFAELMRRAGGFVMQKIDEADTRACNAINGEDDE